MSPLSLSAFNRHTLLKLQFSARSLRQRCCIQGNWFRLVQVIHTVALNTEHNETLYFDNSHHFYHCSNTNHSWPLFFNGAVPVPHPEEKQVLETCTTVTTDDMFRRRLVEAFGHVAQGNGCRPR